MKSTNSDYNEIDEQLCRAADNTVFDMAFEPAITDEDTQDMIIDQMIEIQLNNVTFDKSPKIRAELRGIMRELILEFQAVTEKTR